MKANYKIMNNQQDQQDGNKLMVTPQQVYMAIQKEHPMQFGCYVLPEDWQIDAMEKYSDYKNKELISLIKIHEQRIAILRRALGQTEAKEISTHDGSEI